MGNFGAASGLPTGRGWAAALLVAVVLLVVSAYYPFDWDPPRMLRNHVTRTAGGTLRFGSPSTAASAGTPAWLDEVRATGRVEVDLEVSSWTPADRGPVAIAMLADSYWRADFVIGQDRDELLVWLRRTGRRGNGAPPFAVPGVFRPRHWVAVRLSVTGEAVRVDVDGVTRLSEPLPEGSPRRWVDTRFALSREIHWGGQWLAGRRSAPRAGPSTTCAPARSRRRGAS